MVQFCPKCGTKSPDDEALFCNKCGNKLPVYIPEKKDVICPKCRATVLDINSVFCDKCGSQLRASQPVQPSYYIPPADPALSSIQMPPQRQGPISQGSTKPRSAVEWIGICCGGIILLVIASALLNGITDNIPSSSSSDDRIYSQALSSMALTIDDMPSRWQGHGSLSETGDNYTANFINPSLSPEVLDLEIQKFSTIEQAKTKFNSLRTQNPDLIDLKIESLNIGNEGFGYINVNDMFVIFRKGNVLVTVENIKSPYSFSLTLDDAKKYAKIVEKRIK